MKEFVRSGFSGQGGWWALQFRAALAATTELSGRDVVMRQLLMAGPSGRAVVRIAPRGVVHRESLSLPAVGWVEVCHGGLRWGWGEPAVAADVEIIFRNEVTAAAALRGELDQLAALGRGDVVVRGLVPLAETLGLVMDRLGLYFKGHGRLA
jgi:hypothetical protein